MKKLIYLSVIVLILLAILIFLRKPKTNTNLLNEVSLAQQLETDTQLAKHVLNNNKTDIKEDVINSAEQNNIQKSKERSISYLTAYRESKQFSDCFQIYLTKEKGKDLISDYINKYDSYKQFRAKPTSVQLEYYQMYIDVCNALFLSDNGNLRESMRLIDKRFAELTPETEAEIALSKALEIETQLDEILSKIRNEQNGSNQLTDEQKKSNYKKQRTLIKEIETIYDRNDGDLSDGDFALVIKINEELRELKSVEDFEPNAEEIAYLQQQLPPLKNQLIELFKDHQTPDVFLIFANYLLSEYMTPTYFIEDINKKLGIYDTQYIRHLNKVIVPFIACALEFPCGPQSLLAIKHCTHPSGPVTSSCGKSIEEYYLEDLIGPNQMIDFNNYFNYLMDNYAQN
ncbi:MAG: hypothetical protein AB8B80_09380 [Marinicellaceae bacterium]